MRAGKTCTWLESREVLELRAGQQPPAFQNRAPEHRTRSLLRWVPQDTLTPAVGPTGMGASWGPRTPVKSSQLSVPLFTVCPGVMLLKASSHPRETDTGYFMQTRPGRREF